jgi:archaellum component FlaC
MSEERLERIENQLGQVLQGIIGLSDRITGLEARMTRIEDRMTRIEDRVDIMEGTLLTTMRGGFNSLRGIINDVDVDLARNEKKAEDNARQIRRLNQRLMHLEGRTLEGRTDENINP